MSHLSISYRGALDSDRDYVFKLMKQNMKDYFDDIEEGWSDEKFHAGFEKKRITIIEFQGHPIGFYDLDRADSKIWHWRNLQVNSHHQRKGVGRNVCDRIISEARTQHVQIVEGKVFVANHSSISFLKSQGAIFGEYQEIEKSYPVHWNIS